jgi:hypothetical protein
MPVQYESPGACTPAAKPKGPRKCIKTEGKGPPNAPDGQLTRSKIGNCRKQHPLRLCTRAGRCHCAHRRHTRRMGSDACFTRSVRVKLHLPLLRQMQSRWGRFLYVALFRSAHGACVCGGVNRFATTGACASKMLLLLSCPEGTKMMKEKRVSTCVTWSNYAC